jgi:hypothetical protein
MVVMLYCYFPIMYSPNSNLFSESKVGRYIPQPVRRLAAFAASKMWPHPRRTSSARPNGEWIGLLTAKTEHYERGVYDRRSGLRINPGDTCVRLGLPWGPRYERSLGEARASLGRLARVLATLDPDQRPQHIVGGSYEKLIRTASARFGFQELHVSQRVLSLDTTRNMDRIVSKRAERGMPDVGRTMAVAYMPTDEFIATFGQPRQTATAEVYTPQTTTAA